MYRGTKHTLFWWYKKPSKTKLQAPPSRIYAFTHTHAHTVGTVRSSTTATPYTRVVRSSSREFVVRWHEWKEKLVLNRRIVGLYSLPGFSPDLANLVESDARSCVCVWCVTFTDSVQIEIIGACVLLLRPYGDQADDKPVGVGWRHGVQTFKLQNKQKNNNIVIM